MLRNMRYWALIAVVLASCTGTVDEPVAVDGDASVVDDTSARTGEDSRAASVDSVTTDDTAKADDTASSAETIVADTPADVAVDAGPPGVRFIGRFDTSDPTGPKFAWSGSAMRARFTGTAIRVKLGGAANQFAVVIDGGATTVLKKASGATTHALASGLSPGEHEVLVHRRTEAFFGDSQFLGFEIDGGALLPPPPARTRRLEIIGDSITCGYGNEGKDQYCSFTADTENHYLTYGALAARSLSADIHVQAWSGIGMYRNNDGATTGTMPERWARTLPQSSTSTWDTSKYLPHAVIINLGTNDFAKGDPGKPFETAYLTFVRRVRKAYPDAWILPAAGPMMGGGDLASLRTYLNNVIATLKAEGDTKLALVDFPTQVAADGFGCDWHPSLGTNAKMAKVLETMLVAKLAW